MGTVAVGAWLGRAPLGAAPLGRVPRRAPLGGESVGCGRCGACGADGWLVAQPTRTSTAQRTVYGHHVPGRVAAFRDNAETEGAQDAPVGSQGKVEWALSQCDLGGAALDAQGRLVFAAACTNDAESSVFGRAWL